MPSILPIGLRFLEEFASASVISWKEEHNCIACISDTIFYKATSIRELDYVQISQGGEPSKSFWLMYIRLLNLI